FDVTGDVGPVALPAMEGALAKELLETVADEVEWTRADLRGLPEGSPWLAALDASAGRRGFAVELTDDGVAPFIPLPASFDGYLAALPSKLRHEIRRKGRRLQQDAGDYRMAFSIPESVPADMDRFIELHRQSPGPNGTIM